MKSLFLKILSPVFIAALTVGTTVLAAAEKSPSPQGPPVVDLSGDTSRQVVIAQGTAEIYQGHPTTLLLPDGKTMYCVWTLGHGGSCGPMKRSDDGGKTWSGLLPVPDNWSKMRNCPALYRLTDPKGVTRLFVFAGQGPGGTKQPDNGSMQEAYSMDNGKTWTPMTPNGLTCIMPFCTIVPVDAGKRLIGLTNIRRPGEKKDRLSNIIAQSESTDGGLSWSPWRILVDLGDLKPCEPQVIRSPDGKQLLCLMRENVRTAPAHFMTSDDEGRTWTKVHDLPPGLFGDRHQARYAPDGRLVACFRDTGKNSPTRNHFVAWVGHYEDIIQGRDGQYKIKLLHSYHGGDCGYPGLELLPDGTFVATTYIKYREGPEKNSVVSTRFKLAETDKAKKTAAVAPVTTKVPMLLTSAASPSQVEGKHYDLIVVGGTPGGIACAVRAAREGLSVLLVNHTQHLGGFVTSGAGGWEAPYDGLRSPLYGEMRTGAADYYRKTYGKDSPQYLASLPSAKSRAHIDRPKIEPRIAEMLFNQMVAREKTLTVLLGHIVDKTERAGSLLKSVTFRPLHGNGTVTVSARVFADAMYEGDLMAAAGVSTQIGREARSQYNEPHAGVVYTKERHKARGQRGFPKDADEGRLNIRYNSHATGEIVDGPHSGEADGSVMAYNYRLILTREASNKIMVTKPANYDVAIAKAASGGGFVPDLPNNKVAWNGGRLIGPQNDYPAADWPARERISRQYLDAMLMRLWYVQNDPGAAERDRKYFAGYGLAPDEFTDNGHLPYEIYVREARRLIGRYVFVEQDNIIAPGTGRTPIHTDSVAITDWPVDSVACLNRKTADAHQDGIIFLAEESRPAQVPYRCLLTREIDNLLVPVSLSASHVGWGPIRLEPVWMQTGEAAGFAAALAVKHQTTPARLDPDLLLHTLVKNRMMVSFFNDVDVTDRQSCIPAAEYFGTKGFFASYDARLEEKLNQPTAKLWVEGLQKLQNCSLDPQALAQKVAKAGQSSQAPVTHAEFLAMLPASNRPAGTGNAAVITRGEAVELLFGLLP